MDKQSSEECTLDRLLNLLTDRRRRFTLYYLRETDADVVTLDEVTDHVATWEAEWKGSTGETRKRICTSLHHNHLPRLAEAGLIEYDARSQTVRNRPEPSLTGWLQPHQAELPHLRALLDDQNDELPANSS